MSSRLRWVVLLAPFAMVGLVSILLAVSATREAGIWLLLENHPVEIATFLALLAAGLAGIYHCWAVRRRGGQQLTQLFFLAFGVGLILTGMEEMAWGQYWLGFETPAVLAELNVKGEATLHNIVGLDGRTEMLRVLFGVGGLVGVWLNGRGWLAAITPPSVLWTWFAVITVLAMYDLASDLTPINRDINSLVFYLNELVELLIGLAALLFVSLKVQESKSEVSSSRRA